MTTEKIITSLDQHGRMLIPSNIRERFNISPKGYDNQRNEKLR
jgi:bifunctional DNA-binding transcriptional regulator/antitoxin component of YhaV-PrlF toxin-antitoxin module